MQIPTNFTVLPNSQTGAVYSTEFTYTAAITSCTSFTWDFGDGIYEYEKPIVKHTYQYPGIYTVNLSAWTDSGVIYTDVATINVDYITRDAIVFTKYEKVGAPGQQTATPFVISLTSAKIDQPISIVLQALNSRSVPYYNVPDKWRFITPCWRFVDADTKEVVKDSLVVNTAPIYDTQNNKVIAVSGEASFYYIDDLATGTTAEDDRLLLIATLSTEQFAYPKESLIYPYASYSNSEVCRAMIYFQIIEDLPTSLKVTENYLNDIYPIKWVSVPIPVMITCESGNDITSAKNLSYPKTNEIGLTSKVNVYLESSALGRVNSNLYTVNSDNSDIYFKATDDYGNVASGYIFTTVTPLSPIAGDLTIVATTDRALAQGGGLGFSYPYGYPTRPGVYVSHPLKGVVNKIDLVLSNQSSIIDYYSQLGVLVEGSVTYFSVPILTSVDITNYSVSGTAAVYGMAVNPVEDKLYVCDAEQNTLSIYSSGTTLLTSVQLSSNVNGEVLAPFYISIDKNYDLWISLFDDRRLLKFDSNLNYLLSAAPSFNGVDFLTINASNESNLVSPPIVETDMENNVWACYTNPISSLLVKFDFNGNELLKAPLPGNSMPVSLAIDATNGVWVACKNTNQIMRFDSFGNFTTAVSNFLKPSYIAIDRNNNVWVAHGYNICSLYNTLNGQTKSWKIYTSPPQIVEITNYTQTDINDSIYKEEIWGGLSVDVDDKIWVVDSENNKAVTFSPANTSNFRMIDIVPPVDTNYILKPGDNFVTNIQTNKARSAQAGGDWTGNRWYQKYAGSGSGAYASNVMSGRSTPFRLYDIKDFQIAKINEDFDCAAYFKNLALPEILSNNTTLFDEFFAAVVGDSNPSKESAGRVIYERIANFVSNKGDLETAEVDALLSIAQSMAVDTKSFGEDFPVAVNRLINMFSIPKQRLRGIPELNDNVEENIGTMLTASSYITAGCFYCLKDKIYGTRQITQADKLVNGSTIYTLENLEVEGIRTPILDNYYIFEYNVHNTKGYIGNLIDWDSNYTTISYNLSTNKEWYADGGLVETMFNNLLTKQLFLE